MKHVRFEGLKRKLSESAEGSGTGDVSSDWIDFCEFLVSRQPSRSPSACGGEDAVEFLRSCHSPRSYVDVVGRLSAAFEEQSGNPKENPFRSSMVKRFLDEEANKELLFGKWLTPSDVGKLDRLVIPALHAEKYFPPVVAAGDNGRLLCFEDEDGKPWRFRFSYWNSSQSYVLTKSWSQYVKEKRLVAGDIVSFYRYRSDVGRLFISCRRGPRVVADSGQGTSPTKKLPPPIDPFTNRMMPPLDLQVHHPWLHDTETNLSSALGMPSRFITFAGRRASGMPAHGVSMDDCVLVIYCGDNQVAEETFFINHILQELRQRGVTPLEYDLTSISAGVFAVLPCQSRCGITIFSKNYASSSECLDKLAVIVEAGIASGLVMIPVYFGVKRLDVRDQKGSFGEAFSQLGTLVSAYQVQRWRDALTGMTSAIGYRHIKGDGRLASTIVKDVCRRLYFETSNIQSGIQHQVESILSMVRCSQPSDMQIIGIWGMAGIGKTTFAREIFRKLAHSYDLCYFLRDFHVMCQTKGLSHLRDDFFSKIFGEARRPLDVCDTKSSFVRDRFLGKRILIVLDGVSNARDAEILVGGFDWFSGGHTIILTSTNRQVLVQCGVKEVYEMQKLSWSESVRLFCTTMQIRKAVSLTAELVNYASGIPLALRVLASSVKNQHKIYEKEHLQILRQHLPAEIQHAFRRSFDTLGEDEKNIFLDLACFFRGDNKDYVVQLLDGCGFFTDLGICGLIDESLISLVDNRIEMPNVFQDMGRFVVFKENEDPGKRSRLWAASDIAVVLTNTSGTEAIEAIFLDASGMTCELNPNVFERMYRLRLLKLYCSTSDKKCKLSLPEGLNSLPDGLRLLHWESYPLKCLPRSFNPKNLVELNMPHSNMEKLWKGTKNLEQLKKIRLSHSLGLTKIPRLSRASNLKHIDLEGCTSLVKVSSSIRYLVKLVFLNLKDCSHLRSLPATVHLESLGVLNLSGCSELEDIEDFSPNLKELYLAGTAIREVPSSIGNLAKLVILDLENCKRLWHLPMEMENLESLATLKLSGCSNLKSLPNLDALFIRGSRRLNLMKTTMEESDIQESKLGGSGSETFLGSLTPWFRSETPHMCLSDNTVEKLVTPFEYTSTQGASEPPWQWPTFVLFSQAKPPLSVSHCLASRLYALVSLFLSNACLLDISKEICLLPFLKELDLSRNGFSKLPETIKRLSKLQSLRLRHCRNLGSLPELPQSLKLLNMHGCVSLMSFHSSFEQFPRHCIFSNCFNLSLELVRQFIANAIGSVESMATEHLQELVKGPAFSICVPASLGRMSCTSVGSDSFTPIHLTPSLRKNVLGFAVSVVVEFGDSYQNAVGFGIRYICSWKTKKGLSHRLERIYHCWGPSEAPKVQKDHMFVFGDFTMLPGAGEGNDIDILDDLVVFGFYPVDGHKNLLIDSCKVKRCGIRVITGPTGESSTSTKRSASSLDPGELSDEEGVMLQSKRVRLRRVIESVILGIRKRKREQSS